MTTNNVNQFKHLGRGPVVQSSRTSRVCKSPQHWTKMLNINLPTEPRP